MSSVRPVARPAQHPRNPKASPASSVSAPSVPASPAPEVSTARPLSGDALPRLRPALRWVWGRVLAYVALTKPRIIELLLVTTLPTMLLAERGFPQLGLVLATLVGGAAAAGAANTLNSYLDRDIDRVMNRTRRRPLVTGEIEPGHALVFGYSLGLLAVVWLGLTVNWAAAGLTLLAILLYVVGYTILLKRRTPQNIVWGGAAGCMPVLIGWSAVTGGLTWAPLVLFGIIFFWTPPHYWPLSMRFRRDYAAAGVPMLPVVARDSRVTFEMVLYAAAMIGCSMALVPVAGMGWIYTVSAAGLGVWFAALCLQLYRRARREGPGPTGEMRVFRGSITYLTLLFAAIAADAVVTL